MLDKIRTFSTSPVGKVVFVIVLIAFGAGFWYVGDTGGGGGVYAVRVGDVTIRPETVHNEYRQEVERLRRRGVDVDPDQARELGLPQSVLGRIIGRAVVDAEAERLGLTATDERLRRRIIEDPVFRGAGNAFDRQIYTEILRRIGMSERAYEEQMRADIARAQYLEAVQAGVVVPRTMAEALYRVVAEQRTARVLAFTADSVAAPAAPDEAALRAWYTAHPEDYTLPEMRTVSAVVLRGGRLAEAIPVSDAEIAAAYDQDIERFTGTERRRIRQMIIADEATARRAHARLLTGDDFATVAGEEAGLPPDGLDLGAVRREALLPEVGAVAFALEVGAISEPVQSLLGWHIVTVDDIAPGEIQPLSAVREQVRAMVAEEKAVAEVVAIANALDDALGGGASLDAAAAALAVPVERFGPFDEAGRGPDGTPLAGLPDAIVATAFRTEQGADSLLTELPDGGAFVLRVDTVTPATLRPFEDVRGAVAEAVVADQRLSAAEAEAEALLQRRTADSDLAALAAEQGRSIITTEPFRRDGSGAGTSLPPELVSALFAAKPNAPVKVIAGDTVWLGEVTQVIEADPQADPMGLAAISGSLTETLGGEVLDQLITALQRRHPVSVNQQVLDQIF